MAWPGSWHASAYPVRSLGRGDLEAEASPNLCGEQAVEWVNGPATGTLHFITA